MFRNIRAAAAPPSKAEQAFLAAIAAVSVFCALMAALLQLGMRGSLGYSLLASTAAAAIVAAAPRRRMNLSTRVKALMLLCVLLSMLSLHVIVWTT